MARLVPYAPNLGPILRRQSGLLAAAAVFSGLVNILMLVGPFYMLSAYDRALGGRSEETLIALTLLMIIGFSIMGAFDALRARLMARIAVRMSDEASARIEAQLLTHSADQNKGFWPYKHLDQIHKMIDSPALMSLFDLPWLPIYFGALFLFHEALGWFGLAAAAILVILAGLERVVTAPARARSQRAQTNANRLGQSLHEQRRDLKAMAMGAALIATHRRNREQAMRAAMQAGDLAGVLKGLSRSLRMILQSAILGLGIWLTLHDNLSGGMILAASILLSRALAPIDALIGHLPNLSAGLASWRNLARWLNQTHAPARKAWPASGKGLEIRDLTVIPPAARMPALRQVNASVAPGTVLGVIGPSSSGKSALLAACAGVLPATNGQIRIGGVLLSHLDQKQGDAPIGYCPSQIPIFPASLIANIARLSEEPDLAAVQRAAALTGIDMWAHEMPDGLDTELTETIFLTDSQRHSIGLARAIYSDPPVVLLDMPDVCLDDDGTERLHTILQTIKASGGCAIITTYKPSTLAACDTVLHMSAGQAEHQCSASDYLKRGRSGAA